MAACSRLRLTRHSIRHRIPAVQRCSPRANSQRLSPARAVLARSALNSTIPELSRAQPSLLYQLLPSFSPGDMMKSHALAASAALVLSSALLAQAVGETPTPPAIPGEASLAGRLQPAARSGHGAGRGADDLGQHEQQHPDLLDADEVTSRSSSAVSFRPRSSCAASGLRFDEAFSGYKGQTIDIADQASATRRRRPSTMSATFASNFDVTAPAAGRRLQAGEVHAARHAERPSRRTRRPGRSSSRSGTPFVWIQNTNRNNLLIEIVVYGNTNNNAIFTYPLDAHNAHDSDDVSMPVRQPDRDVGHGWPELRPRDELPRQALEAPRSPPTTATFGTGCPWHGRDADHCDAERGCDRDGHQQQLLRCRQAPTCATSRSTTVRRSARLA